MYVGVASLRFKMTLKISAAPSTPNTLLGNVPVLYEALLLNKPVDCSQRAPPFFCGWWEYKLD